MVDDDTALDLNEFEYLTPNKMNTEKHTGKNVLTTLQRVFQTGFI